MIGALLAFACAPAAALAAAPVAIEHAPAEPAGVEHLHYAAGPYHITPGANLILFDYRHVPKPNVDGYMLRMQPNARYALPNGKCCGTVPLTNIIHLHHGVWLTNGPAGAGEGNGYQGGFYPFMATGEEKTIYELPTGYGYPVGARDFWVLNYMIHDLISTPANIYITYNVDFLPATAPAAAHITPVHPIWMDVEAHHIYPVFDVHRGSGKNGKFTFPDMAKNPYGNGPPLNEFTIDHPGTLIATAGHLHPGGLYDDLDLIRAGQKPGGGAIPGTVPNSVRLFRSNAHYWDPRGPISWDMAMQGTPTDWRPAVKAGDVLRISATYETKRASWYESMGIMVVWEAYNDQTGVDPFTHELDENGEVTHGHLPENNDHGGSMWVTAADVNRFKDCRRSQVLIAGFTYLPGDITSPGSHPCIPTVTKGRSLTFVNEDANPQGLLGDPLSPSAAYVQSIFHTITSCQNPCGLDTGISYPLANGAGGYDSGQLGAGLPAVGRLNWSTPKNLAPGTYYFYCRIHPFMRGVFRIIQ
jgi:hypothetical protein